MYGFSTNLCVQTLRSMCLNNPSCIGGVWLTTLMLVKVAEMVVVLNRGCRMSLCPWPFWDSYRYRPSASPDKSTQDSRARMLSLQLPAVIAHA